MHSHTPNTYIDTDNIFSDYDSSQTTKPIAAYFMLTGHPYNKREGEQQSLGIGLHTMQYRHTFPEDRYLKYSPQLSMYKHLYNLYTVTPKFTHNMQYHNSGTLNA